MDKLFETKSNTKNVFLNHMYAIINEDTYDALKKSDFLKNEFCHCQEKTHTCTDKSWTGFYITGENTYLELFNRKDEKRLHAMNTSTIGLGFSVDCKEELDGIAKLFKQQWADKVAHNILEKKIGDNLVPWFYYVELPHDPPMMPTLDTWIMAYHKDYLTFLNVPHTNENSITRKVYNEHCNATVFDKNKLFKDIEEITLSLNDEIRQKFIERQWLLGYTCTTAHDAIMCHGPGITFILKPSTGQPSKLLAVRMSLNRSVNTIQRYKLGNSTIELENQTATWKFD